LNDVKDAAEWIEDQLDRVGEISWERALRILSQIDDQAHSSEGIG
jgi:hypothetical protein